MIFLYRFDIKGNGIDFILNEGIAEDMYADCNERIKPFVLASCETLLRYKHLSISETIMDANILDTGGLEIMLSRGLGKYFKEVEENNLFKDAKHIADILMEVMDRRTLEIKNSGKVNKDPEVFYPSNFNHTQQTMELMGNLKWLQEEFEALVENRPKPKLENLKMESLPTDVEMSRGYDPRGRCYNFTHKTLGYLGRMIVTGADNDKTLLLSELNIEQRNLNDTEMKKRKEIFEKVIEVIHRIFHQNFPL